MITRCLITCYDGFWWRMPALSDAIAAAERINGIAIVADVNKQQRTARLVRAIRGDGPARPPARWRWSG